MFSPGHAMSDLEGKLLSVDDQLCELLSRERNKIIGRTILEITVEADRMENMQKLARLRERREAFMIRKSYKSEDGSLIRVQNHVHMLTDGLGGDRLVATIIPLATPKPALDLSAMLAMARTLTTERMLRTRLLGEEFVSNVRWDLLLTVYILESEGRSTVSSAVCLAAKIEEQSGILALWELIGADYLVPEGSSLNLREIGVALSAKGSAMLSAYLEQLREIGAFITPV